MLATSIGTLSDLHPELDLVETLQQAVQAAKQLFDADATGVMLVDIDGQLRWASASDQRAQTLEDNQEAFIHLRQAARSSGRKLSDVAAEVAAGQPLPRGRARPARAKPEQPDGEAGAVQTDT